MRERFHPAAGDVMFFASRQRSAGVKLLIEQPDHPLNRGTILFQPFPLSFGILVVPI